MTIWRWAALAALLTVAVALAFAAIPGIGACGASGSWVAFQKVSSVAAVDAMVRPDCAHAFVPALRQSMWFDALVFMPVYGAFLALTFRALKPLPRLAGLAGAAALMLGLVADQVEGFRLLAILDAMPGTQAMIDGANAATFAKKICLSFATLVIGLLVIRDRGAVRLFGAVAAASALAVALASLASNLGDIGEPVSQYGLLVAWLALAFVAGIKGFRRHD
jgi:hypothetical protein